MGPPLPLYYTVLLKFPISSSSLLLFKTERFLKPNIGSRASSEKTNLTVLVLVSEREKQAKSERKWKQTRERWSKSHLEGDCFSGVVKEDIVAEI